jgi:hypothetical protein
LRWTEFPHIHEASVCLELEVPDHLVLLSDEEEWHIVLGDEYLCCGQDIDSEYEWYEGLPSEKRDAVQTASWERIFNVFDREEPSQFIQATFWELRLEQVKGVRCFFRQTDSWIDDRKINKPGRHGILWILS